MRYHTVIQQVSMITSRTLRFYCACFDSSSVTAELTDFFVTNFMVNDKLMTRIFTHDFFYHIRVWHVGYNFIFKYKLHIVGLRLVEYCNRAYTDTIDRHTCTQQRKGDTVRTNRTWRVYWSAISSHHCRLSTSRDRHHLWNASHRRRSKFRPTPRGSAGRPRARSPAAGSAATSGAPWRHCWNRKWRPVTSPAPSATRSAPRRPATGSGRRVLWRRVGRNRKRRVAATSDDVRPGESRTSDPTRDKHRNAVINHHTSYVYRRPRTGSVTQWLERWTCYK